MNEWIVAPLLAADPTSQPVYRPSGSEKQDAGTLDASETTDASGEDRRGNDRREAHEDVDDDFARGEDRREGQA